MCVCGVNLFALSIFFFSFCDWINGQFYSTELLQKWLTRLILLKCHSTSPTPSLFQRAPRPDTMTHTLWGGRTGADAVRIHVFYERDEAISRAILTYWLSRGTRPLQRMWKERSRPCDDKWRISIQGSPDRPPWKERERERAMMWKWKEERNPIRPGSNSDTLISHAILIVNY